MYKKDTQLKFIYSEKAKKFCKIFTLLLSTVHTDKSKVKILQNFVAFSEYMNFTATQNLEKAKKHEIGEKKWEAEISLACKLETTGANTTL